MRNNPELLQQTDSLNINWLTQKELNQLIDFETEFHKLSNKKLNFTWKQFWYELFDFDRDVFKYLRVRPVDYYLEKELVDNFNSQDNSESTETCPSCNSTNTRFGYAIGYRWDIFYLILSLLYVTPFPLIKKKHHCFDCGNNFNKK